MSQPKQGNYFMLPNEIFNMDLTAEEIALYGFPDADGGQENLHLLSGVQNDRRSIEDGQQKYSHEIRQAVRREGAHRNRAYRCGAPRRVASKREPDVQDSAD